MLDIPIIFVKNDNFLHFTYQPSYQTIVINLIIIIIMIIIMSITIIIIIIMTGLEIRGCREPRAPLNVPAAPSNICREPKYVLFDIQNNSMKLMKMQLGSLEKILISSPE